MSDSRPLERHVARLPEDWRIVNVGELGSIVGGSTPSRNIARFWNGDIPWVTPGELTGLATTYLLDTREHITKAGMDSCGTRLLPEDSLLVTSRATIGSVALVRKPTATNQGFKSIIFGRGAEPRFYYHLFQRLVPELERRASGTTFLEISGKEFCAVRVAAPTAAEQRRIAEMLDTLDEAIRKTDQFTAKLKQVKLGLLHDLLTRGIDENGELRDPVRHPEQFKNSRLGMLPRAWEVASLRDLAAERITNGVFKEPSRVGGGVPLLNVGDLYGEFGVDLGAVERFRAGDDELRRFAVEPGDLFFTRSSLNLSGIAHCNVVREVTERSVFDCHLMRVRVDRSRTVPEFVARWCRSWAARSFFMGRAKQVTMTTISQPDIAPLPVPIPTLDEQRRIVEVVDGHEGRVRCEEVVRRKLSGLKLALADDLLSGKVRVTGVSNGEGL